MSKEQQQGQVYEYIQVDEENSHEPNKNNTEIYNQHSQQQTTHHQHYLNSQQQQSQQQYDLRPSSLEYPLSGQQQSIKEYHSNYNNESQEIRNQCIIQYQSYLLQSNHQETENIQISINRNEKRGGLMSYYYVYLIEGHDNKGNFSIARRFNEFYEMRSAIVSRWPGCFVPSIPAKNALSKNDPAIIKKRTRYLDDFVKKIAKLPHLYYGEQFQTLLRSQQPDVSETFSKWPKPTSQSIINKYRVNFSSLAGKQLNFETQQKIDSFHQLVKRNSSQLIKEREAVKQLAESYDKVIKSYASLFTAVFPVYEKECYSMYCQGNQGEMLYMNEEEVKLQEHPRLTKQATGENPYWLLYDLIRHQERDALAFNEVFLTKLQYEQKNTQIQQKIIEYERSSNQFSMGKKPMLGFSQKSRPQEIRQKLQNQLGQLQRQKQNTLIIIDLISAMIAYIEIERYRKEKTNSYRKALGKTSSRIQQRYGMGLRMQQLERQNQKKMKSVNDRRRQQG